MTYEELQILNNKAYEASELVKELSQMLGAYYANCANLETRLAEANSERDHERYFREQAEAKLQSAIPYETPDLTGRTPRPLKTDLHLQALIEDAKRRLEAMTPEEREVMYKAQRESWTRQDMD